MDRASRIYQAAPPGAAQRARGIAQAVTDQIMGTMQYAKLRTIEIITL